MESTVTNGGYDSAMFVSAVNRCKEEKEWMEFIKDAWGPTHVYGDGTMVHTTARMEMSPSDEGNGVVIDFDTSDDEVAFIPYDECGNLVYAFTDARAVSPVLVELLDGDRHVAYLSVYGMS